MTRSKGPRLWVIVSCMGRLTHLRVTAPAIIESGRVSYCLVDFSCPDGAGLWLGRRFAAEFAEERVHLVECAGETKFHKTRALNAGARTALARGAEVLCFADADTIFGRESLGELQRLARAGCFLITGRHASGRSERSLSGVLVVAAEDFERVGGYDEAFVGWGSEDIAMRLKLHLCAGLEARELPSGLIGAIPHSDWQRTRFAPSPNLLENAARNEVLLRALVERWTGRSWDELPASAQALLFRP